MAQLEGRALLQAVGYRTNQREYEDTDTGFKYVMLTAQLTPDPETRAGYQIAYNSLWTPQRQSEYLEHAIPEAWRLIQSKLVMVDL